MKITKNAVALATILGLGGSLQAQTRLTVDLPNSPGDSTLAADSAVRLFSKNLARLTKTARDKRVHARLSSPNVPFSIPTTVVLRKNGNPLPPRPYDPGDLVLQFDSAGTRSFPTAYRAQLEAVFATAKPTLDALFGVASSAGNVKIANYDADIGDREAVSGGYYMPNGGTGTPEIRFPVYVSPEATAVNFIHCLLLAYLGPNQYGFDGWNEGVVRAMTMRVARTPGALPATLDAGLVESVLDSSYDVGNFYDWYNQRALGGKTFIAPNLRSVPLPAGGSLGGIYLLRYQMAGSAWQKAVAESPGFIRELNARLYANPTASGNEAALLTLGQQALDAAAGTANARIEGSPFAAWADRQFILEPNDTYGQKLLVQPIPIASGLGGPDYGVFDVLATYFETQVGGNEILLSGTSYPIFWDQTYNRIFPSLQEDRMAIAGAFGSVSPNLPDINGGVPYRCAIDIPVGDRIARAYVPAGSIATAANPSLNNIYGTVLGMTLGTGQTGRVRFSIGSTVLGETPVRNGAFGASLTQAAYGGYARLKVEVIRRQGTTDSILYTRLVNKGPGSLALDLRVGGDTTLTTTFTKGIQAYGFALDPFASQAGDVLGLAENQVLAARYDAQTASYDLYPDTGALVQGGGYFVRSNAAGNRSVVGRTHPSQAVAVSLKPGWNLIANPLNETTPFSRVQSVRTTEAPKPLNEALGVDLGVQAFAFVPGANDPVTGAPEGGTYAIATNFPVGKAIFVRVLAPEGVTLLFSPAGSLSRPGTIFQPNGWSGKLSMQGAAVELANSTTATTGFDRREDSGLPPAFGSKGIRLTLGTDLYRDSRPIGQTNTTWSLTASGLRPGTRYEVKFDSPGAQPVQVINQRDNKLHRVFPGQTFFFFAGATTERFEVRGGGR